MTGATRDPDFSFDEDADVRRATVAEFAAAAKSGPRLDGAALASRYEERADLGRGGMSVVRRVYDSVIRREVARKELDLSRLDQPAAVARFLEESQITSQLDHPNVVPIYDIGADSDGKPTFITMKRIEGRTLAARRSDYGGTPSRVLVEEFVEIFLKVCDAIAFAHSRGVLHRDLKPENVMVGEHGVVYVLDWGIARTREAPMSVRTERPTPERDEDDVGILGTPAYMAPEQAWGLRAEVGERTDVFGLGGVLYHFLTGVPPLSAPTLLATLDRARRVDIVPPDATPGGTDLPFGLCRIAMKALAPKPRDRYASVAELAAEVRAFARGGGWFAIRSYAPGDVIVRQGDPASEAYIVQRGRCRVMRESSGTRVPIRELGPGDVFGETAIFAEQPRSATVEAIDDVEVTVITRATLDHELARTGWLDAFVRALAERFLEVDERLARSTRSGRTS